MKNNLVWLCLLVGFCSFWVSSICAQENKITGESTITVELKLVCDNDVSGCEKVTIADTNEELYVQKSPVVTLNEITSAEARIEDAPQHIKNMLNKMGQKFEPGAFLIISLNAAGKEKLNGVTSQNIGKRIAIFIDGELVLAPQIREPISGGEFNISYTSFEKAKILAVRINQAINKQK